MPSAARQARTAWSSNATGAPNTAMIPSPVNLSTVPPQRCTTADAQLTSSVMISRSRSAPTAEAMSIECTTSANKTVTCLYSARVSCPVTGAPQPSQNRASSRGLVPHVRHAAVAVIRPSADPGPQGSLRIGGWTPDRDPPRGGKGQAAPHRGRPRGTAHRAQRAIRPAHHDLTPLHLTESRRSCGQEDRGEEIATRADPPARQVLIEYPAQRG